MTLGEAVSYALEDEEAGGRSHCPALASFGVLSSCQLYKLVVDDTTADNTQSATLGNNGQPRVRILA